MMTRAALGPFQSWLRSAELVVHLVGQEFRIRYRRAYLGWLWAIAQPLARLVVLTIVFTKFLPLGIPNYAVFLFTGLIAWTWFASAVASSTTSVIERQGFEPAIGPRSQLTIML